MHLVGFLESISGALCLKMSVTQFSLKWGFSPTRVKPGFSPAGGLNPPTLVAVPVIKSKVKKASIVYWLEHCAENDQVVSSNHSTCICGNWFL